MTQEELAGELNVTRQALSNWERDVNEPDLNMLKKICFLFGVKLAASGTGVTGIFGILLCLAQPVQYVIMFAVAALVSFAVSFVLYKDEPKASEQA